MMSTWSRLFFCAGSFSAADDLVALGGVVVHQIGDLQHAAVGRLDELEAGRGVGRPASRRAPP